MEIIAERTHYYELNNQIKRLAEQPGEIVVRDVFGQRYMGCGLKSHTKLTVHGTLGNDSACYMDGATLEVFGNAQDGIANTMNDGKLIIHGNCGDIMGYGMRGGTVYVQGYAGYRAGIHMKEYMDKMPKIIIGGKAGDFLGEYMAGGRIVVLGLGLGENELSAGRFYGTGMHGGKMFIRGKVNEALAGREIKLTPMDGEDRAYLTKTIDEYKNYFGADVSCVKLEDFKMYQPKSSRPYGNMYIAN
jgi:glutamate synthase domain-containing protein 3